MSFQPNYQNIVYAALNKKSERLPLYEHHISPRIMEKLTGSGFSHLEEDDSPEGMREYFTHYCNFYRDFGYDTVTYEACICQILPFGGALTYPQKAVITDRESFKRYPFDEVKDIFIKRFDKRFAALRECLPEGMRCIGGVGNGVLELAQDLAGYENLCLLSYEDEELYTEIFKAVGRLQYSIWEWFLKNYSDLFCVCRFGDDLGFKSNTLLPYDDIRKHVVPQYKNVIDLIHSYGRPFLLHSCGNIFGVMDDLIAAGIDAKHSNEDQIAPMSEWVKMYGGKIGNFGGVDTDHLVRLDDEALKKVVLEVLELAGEKDGGFAVGSGNSIPDYVDPKKYLLMIDTVRRFRGDY
jgi:uroporphyrinogen decarboxylase